MGTAADQTGRGSGRRRPFLSACRHIRLSSWTSTTCMYSRAEESGMVKAMIADSVQLSRIVELPLGKVPSVLE
jgi:hypothetical protein